MNLNNQKINTNEKNEFNSLETYQPYLLNYPESKLKNVSITSTLINKHSIRLLKNNQIDWESNNKTYKDSLYEYLKSLTPYLPKLRHRGISLQSLQHNSYLFNRINPNISNLNNQLVIPNIQNTNKLLKSFFKSLYCIISKPVFVITPDKVTIQLFYYLNIPTSKVYKWFSIFKNRKLREYYNNINNQLTNNFIYNRFIKNNLSIKNRFFKKKVVKAIFKLRGRYFKQNSAYSKLLIFKLFKYNLNKVYQNKFKIICDILSKKFNRPVELHLTRLHHPYKNSNILVNLLAMNLKNKRKKSRVLINKIYNKKPVKSLNSALITQSNLLTINKNLTENKSLFINNLKPNAFISGLNIKIAGRLMREAIVPRLTTKIFEKGARATGKVNFLDTSSITAKNKKGAFTIKIVTGQNFYI